MRLGRFLSIAVSSARATGPISSNLTLPMRGEPTRMGVLGVRSFGKKQLGYAAAEHRNVPDCRLVQREHNAMAVLCRGMSQSAKPTTDNESDEPADTAKSLTQRQRLSKVFAQYGSAAIVFHTGISLTSLGVCYTFISSGVDMVGILESLNILTKDSFQASLAGGAGTFVVAYAVHKVFMPVRIFLTVTCTPLLVRKLRDMGFMQNKK